jgi:hypothetical protein
MAVIRLDQRVERLDPSLQNSFPQLSRATDKYAVKEDSWKAGPRISNYLPIVSKEALKQQQ